MDDEGIVLGMGLVVKKDGKYLDAARKWSEKFWLYASRVAFTDAEDYGGEVLIRFPSGREVPVDESDFDNKEEGASKS